MILSNEYFKLNLYHALGIGNIIFHRNDLELGQKTVEEKPIYRKP